MAGEKTTRVEEIEERQQDIKKKIAQMADMVTSLTERKGITDGPSLQSEPMSWRDGIDPSIVPNLNDLFNKEN